MNDRITQPCKEGRGPLSQLQPCRAATRSGLAVETSRRLTAVLMTCALACCCVAPRQVFHDTKHLKINGTKSLIGHCLGAAAGVEAIATIKVGALGDTC